MSEKPESSGAPRSESPADGVGDALRTAVERTLAVTADSATGTRQRAQSLLDDAVRRGQVAREQVKRGGEEATARLAEAISELRSADDEGLRNLTGRLEAVERRLAALERKETGLEPGPTPVSNPSPESQTLPAEPREQPNSGG